MVTQLLPSSVILVREYIASNGRAPFREWFEGLNSTAAAKVDIAIRRLRLGNFSNVKGVGAGVYEIRIDFGPGYRIYFGKEGEHIVVLFGGGTKKRQQQDIAAALLRWQDYKQRKQSRET